MKNSFKLLFCTIFFTLIPWQISAHTGAQPLEYMEWSLFESLPPLPGERVQPGLAGNYAGIIDDHLIVAGGAHFPDLPPWEGGQRRYGSDVYLLPLDGSGKWHVFENALPGPMAYGVSLTLPEGLLIIGGLHSGGLVNDVFLLTLEGPGVEPVFTRWPALPVPLAYMTGSVAGRKIYVAGGQEPSGSASRHFFVLDLDALQEGWVSLPPWPGPPRSFGISSVQSDGYEPVFYLFGGRNYGPGHPVEVLRDAYSYHPRSNSWSRLDTPQGPVFPVMAGLAVASGENHILLIGGDDGEIMESNQELGKEIERLESLDREEYPGVEKKIEVLKEELRQRLEHHPGFSRKVRYYHTITRTLADGGTIPFPVPVTSQILKTDNKFLIVSGEVRPGVRTPDIYAGVFRTQVERRLGWINSGIIAAYFLILVWIGWFFSKRQKTTHDYFRGGSRVPWWAAGMSIFGTALSAITFMAIPAKTYATEWSYIWLNGGILLVAPLIVYLCVPFYRRLDITSAYEYLERRFNLATRLIASLSFIIFQIGRMGVVLFLPAIALNVVTGMDVILCIALMGLFSLVYTMMGGIEAVIWTDALQVVVLLGGALLAVILIAMNVDGGFAAILSKGAAQGKLHLGDLSVDFRNPVILTVVLAGIFSPLITYGTDQVMVQRYMTTSSEKMAGRSVWVNAVLSIPATLIFFFVGTALFVFYQENPLLLSPTVTGGDSIFPWFVFTRMPPGVVGLLIAGLFAAAMSTLSSSMNSAATAYTVDFHDRLGWSSGTRNLNLARTVTLILGTAGILSGMFMATMEIVSLWDQFQRILGLILGGVGGLFFLGMTTRRANGTGAIIGLTGSIVVQIWLSQTGAVHLLLFAATGFVSCFILGYFASFLTSVGENDITHLTMYRMKR